jgi:multisubunit Na+/H+ antiporter MnhF subunit
MDRSGGDGRAARFKEVTMDKIYILLIILIALIGFIAGMCFANYTDKED